MRVVIASRIFAPEPAAASFRLAALAEALHAGGAQVTVLTSAVPQGIEDVPKSPIEILRARVLRDKSGGIRGYLPYLSFDIPLVFRLLFVRRPDVVVVEPPPTTGAAVRVVCALRRIPYVYYAADILSDAAASAGTPRPIVSAVRALERWVLRGASAILSVSDGVTARLVEFGVAATVATIGNGVDTSQFSPVGDAHDLGAPFLVYAGTASEVHGSTIFLEAFESVLQGQPDVRLVFIGQGSDREAQEGLAERLPKGTVHFEPQLPASEVGKWLRGAQASLASVRPDQGYDFAFPTKMYASLACGTPVIYAGVGPGRTFAAQPGLGWAVDYSVAEVADAMSAALTATIGDDRRSWLAGWAVANVSLSAVAERAAQAVSRAAR